MNIFFIDNFDSFSFNLVDDFRKRGAVVEVWRNDLPAEQALDQALALSAPRLIVLSPGPGSPRDAGCCLRLVQLASGRLPLFGVCLGLQAIVEALGGEVAFAGEVVHGKSVWIEHQQESLFAGMPSPLQVGRYHSLAASRVPDELRVTARFKSIVMAVAHQLQPTIGVQFHPESILTPQGGLLLDRLLAWAAAWQPQSGRTSDA